MAEHTEGTETPLRRSRRLCRGAPLVIPEVVKEMLGLLKETEEELSGVRAENEEDKPGDEETGLEVPQGGEVVLPKEEDTVLAEVGTVQLPAEHTRVPAETEKSEEKKKPLEPAAEPCKRPLLGAKVKSDKREVAIPRGKPKSGRVWKDQNKKRFSGMVKDRPLHTSWDKKMVARREKSLMKDYSRHLKDEKQKAKEEKKRRREENLKRRLENERKAEVVQVITNLAKLKRAKKKQLRRIEKRDTLALVQRGSGLNKKADRLEKFLKKKKEATEAKENTN